MDASLTAAVGIAFAILFGIDLYVSAFETVIEC